MSTKRMLDCTVYYIPQSLQTNPNIIRNLIINKLQAKIVLLHMLLPLPLYNSITFFCPFNKKKIHIQVCYLGTSFVCIHKEVRLCILQSQLYPIFFFYMVMMSRCFLAKEPTNIQNHKKNKNRVLQNQIKNSCCFKFYVHTYMFIIKWIYVSYQCRQL